MASLSEHPIFLSISRHRETLTPKGRLLGDYIMKNHGKAVFMTARELAQACRVSEATVVRFVSQIGFEGYNDFQQALRSLAEMTMMDDVDLKAAGAPDADRFRREVQNEIDNLRSLCESVDPEAVSAVVDLLHRADAIYVVGSRFYFTAANYLGWALTKIRPNIHTLKGSDSTSLDYLSIAPAGSLVIMVAASRYPNELIRLARHVRRLDHRLVVVTDSPNCPLNAFAHQTLIGPARHVPSFGIPTTLPCLLSHLLMELAQQCGGDLKAHQDKIEQTYRDNDILFNL